MTPTEAAKQELARQIKHFRKLGEGKPDDHEYNVTADGLEAMLDDQRDSRAAIDVWTCSAYFNGGATSLITGRKFGYTLAEAIENDCDCLKTGCEAVKVTLRLDNHIIETISSEEVIRRLKK